MPDLLFFKSGFMMVSNPLSSLDVCLTEASLEQLPPLPALISLNSSDLSVEGEEYPESPEILAEILQQTPFYISLGQNRAGGEMTEQAGDI